MKKHIYTLLLLALCTTVAQAQVPDSINYQAIIRYTSGKLIAKNKLVNFKFIVTVGTGNTITETYVETQLHTINNDFGLANLKIGNGTYVSGVARLSLLPWQKANAELQVEVDTLGGTAFSNISFTKLVAVPYAFYANGADSAAKAGVAGIANDVPVTYNNASNTLTIGTNTKLLVRDIITKQSGISNGLLINKVAGGGINGGDDYQLYAKNQELTISGNILSLSGTPASVPINLPTYNYYAGTGLVLTGSQFSFDSTIITAPFSVKNTTRVRFNNGAKKLHVFTPLPHLELNPSNNYLTIRDTLAGSIKDSVDLSGLVKTYTAGNGIAISASNVITNLKPDQTVTFNNTGNTQVTGIYPNFTVNTTQAPVSFQLQTFGNYVGLSINGSTLNVDTLIRSNKLKRVGNTLTSSLNFGLYPSYTEGSETIIGSVINTITLGNLVTQVNGVNSLPISLPRGLDTITFKEPLLYFDTVFYGGNKKITPRLKPQLPNSFLVGPQSGFTAVQPTFRQIVSADLATIPIVQASATNVGQNYITKFSVASGKLIENSKLYESVIPASLGYIGWGTITPLNNFTINGGLISTPASFQLTNATAGLGVDDGFKIKFDGASTTISNKPNGLINFQTNGLIDRMSIADTSVFIKTKLNLTSAINVGGTSKYGASGDVLTSQGGAFPPKWAPALGGSIWTRSAPTIFQATPTDNVNIGKLSNTNPNVKLAVYTTTGFDTAIYAQSTGKIGIIGEVQNQIAQTYGVRGLSNGTGLSTLQATSVKASDYSAGVFGEATNSSNNITYGIIGKTASKHPQGAGVFGIADADSSDGVRGITVLNSKGNAGSFVNFANNNGSPTVFISNQASLGNVGAAALFVDGGQRVKTTIVTANYTQTLGDYIIIANNSTMTQINIDLLTPTIALEGTTIIIRNVGTGKMKLNANGPLEIYSDGIVRDFVAFIPIYGTSSKTPTSVIAEKNISFKLVVATVGGVPTWVEY